MIFEWVQTSKLLTSEVTTKFIINHIQEAFDSGKDVAEALRMMKGPNTDEQMPTVPVSTPKDEATRDRESSQFYLDYKGESADHHKRVRECETDLDKEHVLLWGVC